MNVTSRARLRVAVLLVWAGRLVLVAGCLAVFWCALSYPSWLAADDTPWMWESLTPNIAVVAIMALAVLFPLLAMPVSSGAFVIVDEHTLKARSVLGPRSIEVRNIREFVICRVPGWPHDWVATVVVGQRLNLLVVLDSELWADSDGPPGLSAMSHIAVRRAPELFGVGILIAWIALSLALAAVLAMLVLHVALW